MPPHFYIPTRSSRRPSSQTSQILRLRFLLLFPSLCLHCFHHLIQLVPQSISPHLGDFLPLLLLQPQAVEAEIVPPRIQWRLGRQPRPAHRGEVGEGGANEFAEGKEEGDEFGLPDVDAIYIF